MDLDFDSNIMIQCVECCKVFSIDEAEAINEATSSVKCSCGRWNYVDCPSLFETYIQQTIDDDDGGLLYDFRTGNLESEFPKKQFHFSKAEKAKREKEKRKIVEQLKKDFKKTLGVK
jgi:hypothetical protein